MRCGLRSVKSELVSSGSCGVLAVRRHAAGLTQYLVDEGQGLAKGIELAHRIAGNAPFTNFAVMHLLPRIARSDPSAGFVTEALAAAIAQGDVAARTIFREAHESKTRLQRINSSKRPASSERSALRRCSRIRRWRRSERTK